MSIAETLRSEFELDLEVDGVRFDISAFSSEWRLNNIPTASCSLAIGRVARDGRTPAKLHTELDKFVKMSMAKVYFRPTGQWNSKVRWPKEETVIFEGRITGTGYQKISGQIQFIVEMAHWLVDLDFSSALLSQANVRNPAEYTLASVSHTNRSGLPIKSNGLALLAESSSINFLNVTTDLWGDALKPFLCGLAEQKHVKVGGTALKNCVGLDAGKNDYALQALKRFESAPPNTKEEGCKKPRSCYTPACAMALEGGVAAANVSVSSHIANTIRYETGLAPFAQHTLWGVLIGEYCNAFHLAVVPQVEKALVVPRTYGLRSTYCKQIMADDYAQIMVSAGLLRPIRAVGVLGSSKDGSGTFQGVRSITGLRGLGGCYQPADAPPDGMLYIIGAPRWLSNVTASGHSPRKTTGNSGKNGDPRVATNSATTPVAADPKLLANKDGLTNEKLMTSTLSMYNNFAHAFYTEQMLAGRMGMVSGKLRFDIAPGATVMIEGTSEIFLKQDKLAQNLVAEVVGVSIAINAETAKAGTTFSLALVRTEDENKDDKTSVERHPLYTTKFVGAPLIDRYWFPSDEDPVADDCCLPEEAPKAESKCPPGYFLSLGTGLCTNNDSHTVPPKP